MNNLGKLTIIGLIVFVTGTTTVAYGQDSVTSSTPSLSGNKQQGRNTKALTKLVQAAEKEGEVNFVDKGGFSNAFLHEIEKAMKARYGITLRISVTGGPSMSRYITRLFQEHQAHRTPSTDLIRISTRQRLRLEGKGITDPVKWRVYDPSIRQEEITGDGSGLVCYGDRVGIVYNTKLVSQDMLPKSIWDLADSKYKGMLGTTPYGTGWGESAMLFGSDRVWKLAQKLVPNIAGFTGSSEFEPVITGQIRIFAFSGGAQKALLERQKGAPISPLFPFQAYILDSINMLKGSPHPNASRLFALFLRTPAAQRILWKYRRADSPFVPTSHEYKQVQEARAAGQKVLLYTEADVRNHHAVWSKLVPSINKLFRRR